MKKRLRQYILYPVLLLGIVLGGMSLVRIAIGSNIDPTLKFAWAPTAGWINFAPPYGGVQVYSDHLEGYAWSENVGWIRMGTHTDGGPHTYANTTITDYGVNINRDGMLSGYAWATNGGWINFAPTHGGVVMDLHTGSLDGYAWGENIGWIHFKHNDPTYNVTVNLCDLTLTQSVTPTLAVPGDTVTYTLIFSNTGPGIATDVLITNVLPLSITLASRAVMSSGAHITQTNSSYTWAVADLVQNNAGIITITGTLSDTLVAGLLIHAATITTTAIDRAPDNNMAATALAVNGSVRVHQIGPFAVGQVYEFGNGICGQITFSDTNGVSQVTITYTQQFPSWGGEGLPRQYKISADGTGFTATLTLCYNDAELAIAGIPATAEEDLRLYRYGHDALWTPYLSTVDAERNWVTALLVNEFSTWGIGLETASEQPTALSLHSWAEERRTGVLILLLIALIATVTHILRKTVH